MHAMDMPTLMQLLAIADERRRDAVPGSKEQQEAQREVERLAAAIERASDGEVVITIGTPVIETRVSATQRD